MRKLGLRWTLTGRLFNLGLSWEEARQAGANEKAWKACEAARNRYRNLSLCPCEEKK